MYFLSFVHALGVDVGLGPFAQLFGYLELFLRFQTGDLQGVYFQQVGGLDGVLYFREDVARNFLFLLDGSGGNAYVLRNACRVLGGEIISFLSVNRFSPDFVQIHASVSSSSLRLNICP